MANPIIEMRSIVKNFGEVCAVKGVDFDLRQGEIHSLIGENGAGKSTMMKLLYGMYDRDGGAISINGESVKKLTPRVAIQKGVGMVHQEFMLVPELTVLENIILGFEPKKGVVLDLHAARAIVQRYIDQYGMDVQMNKRVNQISVGEAQRVEIIKILSRGANVLILDEPTRGIDIGAKAEIQQVVLDLASQGMGVVFISSELEEVVRLSDDIEVLKDRHKIAEIENDDTVSQATIVETIANTNVNTGKEA